MFSLLDRYLIREIVPYFLLSLLLLTAIIFAQEASRFSELIVVASRNGLPMQTVWRVMTALLPGILVFTLPVSLLMGTLVGLGRLSGDSEIVALGASGMSRWRMLRPVGVLALIVGAWMIYTTFNMLPRSVRILTDLKQNQSLVFQGLNSEIKPRVFEESIPQTVLYIEDIDRARNLWHNIFLVSLGEDQSEMKIVTATTGALRQGERSNVPELYLQGCTMHQINTAQAETPDQQETREPAADVQSPRPDSQSEGREKKRNRQQSYTAAQMLDMTVGLEVPDDRASDMTGDDREARAVEEMGWTSLVNYKPAEGEDREWRSEIHKRLALPAACFVFALLGVGFGISNVRTGRSFGLILGLAITITYYLLALWGQHAAVLGKTPVWLGMWLANLLLFAAGVAVLLVQRRPGSDPLSAVSSIRHAWPWRQWSISRSKDEAESETRGLEARTEPPRLTGKARRFHLPQLLDRLVLTDLVRFFVYILGGFSVLFLIITLFQLLDSITRNNIDWIVVASYLLFLLPFIMNNVTPLAALVAVIVTFGILQKTSQVVALKASGQSIYRMAAPAVAGSLLLAGGVYFNQDFVMPFTNPRQNNLRYLIRKGQEPPQTFYQTKNQWIFGSDSRIFNYAHFDVKGNAFARFTVLDLSREPFGISRRLYARRATWNPTSGRWALENGWERKFAGNRPVSFESFKSREFELAETPDYFKKDSRGSSSMTIGELQRKIADLSHSGFDVLDLRIALQGKIAFPLTCMVMVLVGLPFSFSVGKRGALYGVAIGIAIGLAYWGLQGLFEQMGRYEVLPPMLAAWGPNVLFGAGGLYLFLHSRT
ncbi:MAG TPA: LptF/LptG family permease [Blastocatellia bacterium]|nr:LptF/LptG family permease [Blastocatellia bacterium]